MSRPTEHIHIVQPQLHGPCLCLHRQTQQWGQFEDSCLLQSPKLFSKQRKKRSLFRTKAHYFASLLQGFILGGSVAGFTSSCSRLIPYSKSGTQRPQSWFLGTRSKALGVKLHSNIHLPAIDLRTNGPETFLLNFQEETLAYLYSSMTVRNWSALRACVLLSYLERQFSFVCCSLALKQVLAAGLSGQQCINHMNPTAGEAATKGQDLMSSAENTKRVNVGLDKALKRSEANSLSTAQSKHFSSFQLNKYFPARIRRIR